MDPTGGYDESLWRVRCEQVGACRSGWCQREFGGAGGLPSVIAAVVPRNLFGGKGLVPSPALRHHADELALLAQTSPTPDALGFAGRGVLRFGRGCSTPTTFIHTEMFADIVIAAHDGK